MNTIANRLYRALNAVASKRYGFYPKVFRLKEEHYFQLLKDISQLAHYPPKMLNENNRCLEFIGVEIRIKQPRSKYEKSEVCNSKP